MKNIISIAVLTCLSAVSINSMAADQTVSIGYAQTKVDDFKNLKGVNVQYKYETEALPVGIVVSTSFMSGKETEYESFSVDGKEVDLSAKSKVKYFSLLAGPSYSFNEYVSTYGLIGFSHIKHDVNAYSDTLQLGVSNNDSKTGFAYGVGVAVNPVENISVNLGYEGTRAKFQGETVKFNGFNIGIGYKF